MVGLSHQKYQGHQIVWAATVAAQPGESNGASYTVDGGDTWHTTLHGERVYNITAADSIVLVASRSGLWKTVTDNPLAVAKPWAKYKPAQQTIMIGSTGMYRMDESFSDTVIGALYDIRHFSNHTLTISNRTSACLALRLGPH